MSLPHHRKIRPRNIPLIEMVAARVSYVPQASTQRAAAGSAQVTCIAVSGRICSPHRVPVPAKSTVAATPQFPIVGRNRKLFRVLGNLPPLTPCMLNPTRRGRRFYCARDSTNQFAVPHPSRTILIKSARSTGSLVFSLSLVLVKAAPRRVPGLLVACRRTLRRRLR